MKMLCLECHCSHCNLDYVYSVQESKYNKKVGVKLCPNCKSIGTVTIKNNFQIDANIKERKIE